MVTDKTRVLTQRPGAKREKVAKCAHPEAQVLTLPRQCVILVASNEEVGRGRAGQSRCCGALDTQVGVDLDADFGRLDKIVLLSSSAIRFASLRPSRAVSASDDTDGT